MDIVVGISVGDPVGAIVSVVVSANVAGTRSKPILLLNKFSSSMRDDRPTCTGLLLQSPICLPSAMIWCIAGSLVSVMVPINKLPLYVFFKLNVFPLVVLPDTT